MRYILYRTEVVFKKNSLSGSAGKQKSKRADILVSALFCFV